MGKDFLVGVEIYLSEGFRNRHAKKHLSELEYSDKINKIRGSGRIPHQYFITRLKNL